jgi:aryl carrier-like protein
MYTFLKKMTISEFFGTLQESITAEWRKHLQTDKYSGHMALDEFYKEMPEKVDALIEAYQADNDIVKDYKNLLDEGLDALEYLEKLKDITKEGRKLLGSSELESLCDDVLSQIDSTIYKLKHLTESGLLRLSAHLHDTLTPITEGVLNGDTETPVDFDVFIKDLEKILTNGGKYKLESDTYSSVDPGYHVFHKLYKNTYSDYASGKVDEYVYDLEYYVDGNRFFNLTIKAWDDPDKQRPRYVIDGFSFVRQGAPSKESIAHMVYGFVSAKKVTVEWYNDVKKQLEGLLDSWYSNSKMMQSVGTSYWSSPQKAKWVPAVNKIVGQWLRSPYTGR